MVRSDIRSDEMFLNDLTLSTSHVKAALDILWDSCERKISKELASFNRKTTTLHLSEFTLDPSVARHIDPFGVQSSYEDSLLLGAAIAKDAKSSNQL